MTEQQLVANRAVVEAELRRMLRRNRNPANTVVLLHAAAQWYDDPEFGFETENGPVQVSVATCPTVLAVLEAISADREPDTYLVVLTPHESHDVGQSVLARAVEPTVWPVNRWDLVRDAFGVRSVDPRLLRSDRRWVSEALLDAQPVTGWRRLAGSVLTESAAMSQLACVRLGLDGADIDAAALLEWSASTVAAARYGQLREAERTKLTEWLTTTAGPVAAAVFGLAARGRVGEAIPFGLAAAALYGTSSPAVARGRAEERYFGGNGPGEQVLNDFGEAAESLVARWTDNGHAARAAAMCERAERILTELGGMAAAAESAVLDAGLNARLTTLGEALGQSLPAADDALRKVREHRRRQNRDGEVQVAEAAVRIARWLATPAEEFPARLNDAATRMIRSWGWADRALGVIGRADTSRVPRLGTAYASLWADGTARRAEIDEEFARKLVSWPSAPGVGAPGVSVPEVLYLLITGTPAFYDGTQGVSRLTPLAQRLATDFGTDARFDSPRAIQLRLSGFDLEKLAGLGSVIRDLYASGSGAEDRVARLIDDGYVADLARAVSGELGGQAGIAPRVFLRKLIADVLDRVAEFPDFDPRQHYKPTLMATELTDVERNATAFRATSADEVELEL